MLLVDVGEEALGLDGRSRQVLRLGERLDERPDIGDDGHVTGRPERLEARKRWMQTIERGAGTYRQRQELRLREREIAAGRRVVGVAGRIERHDHIVRIVSSVEEHAHECLVIIRGRGLRGKQAELPERRAAGERAGMCKEGTTLHLSAPLGIGRR